VLGAVLASSVAGAEPIDRLAELDEPIDRLAEIEEAYRLAPSRDLLIEALEIHAHLPGHCEQTRDVYERFVLSCPDCPLRPRAESARAQASLRCSGALTVQRPAPTAVVRVDGEVVDGDTHRLWSGAHTIRVEQGARAGEHVVCVAAGGAKTVGLAFDDAVAPTAPKARAVRHENRAFERLAKKAYCEAAAELEAAYRIVPEPGYLLNLGVAHEAWGRCVPAMRYLNRYLEACPQCAHVETAQDKLTNLHRRCDGLVTTRSIPDGAATFIDGAAIGSSPVTATVAPGSHVLQVGSTRRAFWLEPGQRRTLSVLLVDPTPPVATPGESRIGAWFWTGVGLTAAGVIVGAIFSASASSDRSELDGLEADARAGAASRADLVDVADRGSRNVGVAYGGFGLAGAGVLVAVGSLLFGGD